MIDVDFIRNRISDLRLKKGVSEYQMSKELGHSRGYIQGITSGRSLPSMTEFLYICDYLGITPKDFFDEEIDYPALVRRIQESVSRMSESNLDMLIPFVERFEQTRTDK